MKRFAILFATTAFVTPAIAADVVYEEPPAPMAVMAAPTWTGFYIGIQGGAAFNPEDPDSLGLSSTFGNATSVPGLTVNGVPNSSLASAFGSSFSSEFDESFIGGAHAGYDYQMGNFVLGGIIDINAVDIAQKQSAFSNTPAFYTAERSLDYLATARLRAGYTVTPTALAYVTGGLAYGEVDYSFSSNSPAITAANPARVFEDEDDFGYTVGAGMEVKVTDNVSFGAEYLYTNLGGDSFTTLNGGPFDGNATAGVTIPGQATSFSSNDDFDFHTVTAKISYRFN
jgi:outer membrane immunogenic protein